MAGEGSGGGKGRQGVDVRTSGNNVLLKKNRQHSRLFSSLLSKRDFPTAINNQTPSSFKGRGQASGPASAGI